MKKIAIAFISMLLPFSAGRGQTVSSSPPPPSDYALQPQDLLEVVVFQEDSLTRQVRVSGEGTVQLPLIGTVEVKDKSLREAEREIRDLYAKDYLVDPQINLMIVEYAPRQVSILGAVNNPGMVDFPKEGSLSLLGAIARAGGFSRLANRSQVRLTRMVSNGQSTTFMIDADTLISGKDESAWMLQPSDVVYVKERIF